MITYKFEVHTLKTLFQTYLSLPENDDLFTNHSRLSFLSSSIDSDEIMLTVLEGQKIIALAALEHLNKTTLLKKYICVDPDYRHQGIGKFLLHQWYEYAKKHDKTLVNSRYSELGKKHLMPKDKHLAQSYNVLCLEPCEYEQWYA